MLSLTGHNYIGGERRAAGTVEHKSLDASSGEALPYTFIQATPGTTVKARMDTSLPSCRHWAASARS